METEVSEEEWERIKKELQQDVYDNPVELDEYGEPLPQYNETI